MGKQEMLNQIPDYKDFLTVDEMNAALWALADRYPGMVDVFEAGRSRGDTPILCAKVGSGARNALFYGCPHPNEPIGAMMSYYFIGALAADPDYCASLGFTFYIIPMIDVDGVRRNEGWFKGPFNLFTYARNYFRPASDEQVEWTFPMDYKNYKFDRPLPETKTLMRLIDEVKPAFIYSLHNAGFGGAYWYTSHPQAEAVFAQLHQASTDRKVPLDLGEPEMPYLTSFAPAIYKMPSAADLYDYLEQFAGGDPAAQMIGGECSGTYAGKAVVELVAELPYYYEARIDSCKELDYPRAKAVTDKLDIQQAHLDALKEKYEAVAPFIGGDNPYGAMVAQTVVFMPIAIAGERVFVEQGDAAAFARPCTESEAFSCYQIAKFYNLLNWGLLVRAIEMEMQRGDAETAAKLQPALADAETVLRREADALEAQLDYSVIPVRDLVAIQLASGLAILEAI